MLIPTQPSIIIQNTLLLAQKGAYNSIEPAKRWIIEFSSTDQMTSYQPFSPLII